MKSIALGPTEQSYKDLLEDRSAGFETKARRGRMTLDIYKDLEGISYDELMMLIQENDSILEHMTPSDPAYNTLLTNRNNFYRVAGALNDVNSLGRYDHMLPVHALVSINNMMVEANFWIPKLNYRQSDRQKLIQATIVEKINQSSHHRAAVRYPLNIDFVEL